MTNQTQNAVSTPAIKKFEVGKTYAAKKSVLFDSQINMTVINRTNCYVTFQFDDDEDDIRRCKIVDDAGVEKIYLHETNAIVGDYEFSAQDEVTETPDTVENETADDEVKDEADTVTEKFTTVKAENATHAVEILDKLNFRNVEFVYHGDTNEHGLPVVYRHFDGIKDGHDTCFGLIEIVIDGKLDAVRFINNYREQFTDIKIGNAKYTLGDKGEINLIDEPETKTDTPEENVEKLFDAYEAQNSVAHISENGYIAAVNFQPQNTVRWHCKIRRYQNLDEAIDAVRYVNEHDTFTVTRGGRVEAEFGKPTNARKKYLTRTPPV